MHTPHALRFPCTWLQTVARQAALALGVVMALSACIGVADAAGAGGDTWQEEVLLHDGRTLIAERYVRRGGRAEVGQSGAYVEQTLRFIEPQSGKTYTWSDSYSAELGMANFLLLALHVVDGVPYVVATPMGCQSYNKWGRPNPPYVVFQWQESSWQRIALADFPQVARSANLLHSAPDDWVRRNGTHQASAQQIRDENAGDQPQYRSIVREVMVNEGGGCRLEFTNSKGAWLSADWFSGKKNLESCMTFCKREEFSETTCPCKQFFKGE